MAPNKKPVEMLVDKRAERVHNGVTVVDSDRDIVVPEPPTGMLEVTKEHWFRFWSSPVARAVDIESDLPALHRWVIALDEYTRTMKKVRKVPLAVGSTGQPVMSPYVAYLRDLEQRLNQYEDRFGMAPRSRANLRLTNATTTLTAQHINEMVAANERREDDDKDAFEGEFVEA